MGKVKLLIVEDDPLYGLDLKILVEQLDYNLIGLVDNAADVFNTILQKKPDVVLMDIKIKGDLNGIEIAEKIKNQKIPVIFITSFDDRNTYEKAKKASPFGYLVKPFNKLTLETAIEAAVYNISKKVEEVTPNYQVWEEDIFLENHVFIKRNSRLEKVAIDKILFIQSEGNYCVISTQKKKYALKMSLIKVKKILDSKAFARVNKRHILNMNLITSIDLATNRISIENNEFSIGRTYKEGLLKRLKTLS